MVVKRFTLAAAAALFALPIANTALAAPTPVITPPANYGHYCSLSYTSGGWAFGALGGATSTPCENMLVSSPGGTIARAGLWDTTGSNNVLLRCTGYLYIYRGAGATPLNQAYNAALGKSGCVFTVAPTKLAIFGAPYGKTTSTQLNVHGDVSTAPNMFNYNVYHIDVDRTIFGQPIQAADPNGHWVDRYGKYRSGMHESAYDWGMPGGKPLLAMAAGRVVDSRDRDVSAYGCGAVKQKEVYIEHQVGSGIYAERFIAYYAHLNVRQVIKEQIVSAGQQIGTVGTTGCSSGNHLHFSALRTTNLSGYRSIAFATTPAGYGVNTIEGVIDPYGWAAPNHIDMWGWMYQGKTIWDGYLNKNVKDPGAFSINLWKPGAAPPIPAS